MTSLIRETRIIVITKKITPWNPPLHDGEEPTLIEHTAVEPNGQAL